MQQTRATNMSTRMLPTRRLNQLSNLTISWEDNFQQCIPWQERLLGWNIEAGEDRSHNKERATQSYEPLLFRNLYGKAFGQVGFI